MLSLGRSIVLLFLLISIFEASNAATISITTTITNSLSITFTGTGTISITTSGSGTVSISTSTSGTVSISTSGSGTITNSGSGSGTGTWTNSGSGSGTGTWTNSGSWTMTGSGSGTVSNSLSMSTTLSASKTMSKPVSGSAAAANNGTTITASVNAKLPGLQRPPAHKNGIAHTCGNGIVESPEECDLGTVLNSQKDSCCHATCFAVTSQTDCNRKQKGSLGECFKPQKCGLGKQKGRCMPPQPYSNGKRCFKVPFGSCNTGLCVPPKKPKAVQPVAPPVAVSAPPKPSAPPTPAASPQPVSGVQPIPT